MSLHPVSRLILATVLALSLVTGNEVKADTAVENDVSGKIAQSPELEQGFQSPADTDKPWAYWWWLKANVDKQSVTHDLEQMKEKGFGGLLMFDARGYHEGHVPPPESRMDFMGPEWRAMIQYSLSEANRLGITMSINLSICAGALKGPWDVGADSPKKLVWAAASVQGGKEIQCQLKRPADLPYYQDIVVLAARRTDTKTVDSADLADALATKWQVMTPPQAKSPIVVAEVLDLTDQIDAQGNLRWTVPEGDWTILRFGYAAMEGHEFDVDVLDPEAVEGHYKRMGKALVDDAGELVGKTLTHFYSVSWEGAIPTWTGKFAQEFAKHRGYAIREYMPVLTGMTVKDAETTQRFLRDYYKTLGDCFRENFYGTLRDLSKRDGLDWHSESGGPWNRGLSTFQNADQLAFLGCNDMPQGEFWYSGRYMNRQPAMASHIYGRRLAATEAFTHMRRHWDVYPGVLKPDADAAFCDGINQFIWHTFTASPPELGKPGSEYFAGTHVNPNVTWWPQAGPFLSYLARCQYLLRQGRFVADVCCYVGDSPYQDWGRHKTWRDGSSLQVGPGNTYDLMTTEVLVERLSVEDGQLVLPDGMRYRVLAIDLANESIPPRVLRKIVDLAEAGVTVVLGDIRAARSPGLENYPECDEEIARLAGQLWGTEKDVKPGCRPLGKGKVCVGVGLDKVFEAEKITPDFQGPWDYIHRQVGDADIYFVSGKGAADCVFRVSGKEPELWNPVTGKVCDAVQWRTTDDGRTVVPIRLPENGSTFVVFRRPAEATHVIAIEYPENVSADAWEVAGRQEEAACLHLWQSGEYRVKTSDGKTHDVKVPALSQPLPLAGPWSIDFTPGVGDSFSADFEQLAPWNESADLRIKYFSGMATYTKTFELNETQAKDLVRLQLGNVKDIATVRLNGTPLGIVWTKPWSVDLSGVAKAGKNTLEIDVTNTWVNRLIGDAGLPPEQRLTKTNILLQAGKRDFPGWKGYASEDPLEVSGLLGPVTIEFGCRSGFNLTESK